jgi:hypothetical protein
LADVFISYKRESRPAIEKLAAALTDLGLDVWFDHALEIGRKWQEQMLEEARTCNALIVCWTPAACRSSWVQREASIGADAGKLIPVIFKACNPPEAFGEFQIGDLIDWEGSPADPRFLKLLPRIGKLTGKRGLARIGRQRAGGEERALVDILRLLLVARARSGAAPLTYEEVQQAILALASKDGVDLGDFAQPTLWGALDEIAAQNRRTREPPLAVLIVSKEDGLPGRGYFQKHVGLEGIHDALETQVFERQLARVRAFPWSRDP